MLIEGAVNEVGVGGVKARKMGRYDVPRNEKE